VKENDSCRLLNAKFDPDSSGVRTDHDSRGKDGVIEAELLTMDSAFLSLTEQSGSGIPMEES
jgi:hypothetical protein